MADLVSYALATVADVKESLGIDAGDTSKDNIIKRKINMATEMIESYCNLATNHHFKETTYTNEVYNGINGDQLVLLMRPVTAVSSFQYLNSNENIDSWDTIDTEDYFIDLNSGLLNGFASGNNFGSIRVSYTAGYSTIPFDLSEACATIAAFLVDNGTSGGGIKRKREGQREIEYFQAGSSGNSSGDSVIEQLNLDGVLNRYVMYPLR